MLTRVTRHSRKPPPNNLFEGLRDSATKGKPLPDPDVDPVLWNALWEKISFEHTFIDRIIHTKPSPQRALDDQMALSNYRAIYRDICHVQYKLTGIAVVCIAAGFETIWLTATPALREKHLIEAHVRVSMVGVEGFRLMCGDITLLELQRDAGKGFIDLLKKFIHDDLTRIPTVAKSYPFKALFGTPPAGSSTDKQPNIEQIIRDLSRDLYLCQSRSLAQFDV